VGIETTDPDTATGQCEPSTGFRREIDGLADGVGLDGIRNSAQREMGRDERHAEPSAAIVLAEEHHGEARGPSDGGDELRLSGEPGVPGLDDGFLAQRGCHQTLEMAGSAGFRRPTDPSEGRSTRARIARREILGKFRVFDRERKAA
jgi:hypothetical protein